MRLGKALPSVLLAAVLGFSAEAPASDEAKIAGRDVPAPKRTKFVAPRYPAEAQALGQRGIVILDLLIDEEGKVASVDVLRSVPPFDEAALEAVRQWEFEVTRVEGRPVPVRYTLPITFALKLPEMTREPGIPELRSGVAPPFPPGLGREGATVTAEVTLAADGDVLEAQVKSGASPWAEALLQAIRTWRFVPQTERVIVSFRVEAEFAPTGKGAPRVDLRLSGLRRSGSAEPADAPAAAEMQTAPDAEPSPLPSPDPASGPSTPALASSAPPRPTAAPPLEVIPPSPPKAAAPAAGPATQVSSGAGASAIRGVALGAGVPDLSNGRRPVVPPLARMAGVSGKVEVRFAVNAAGDTSQMEVAGPELLQEAARQTVASWTFRRTSADRLRLLAVFDYAGDTATALVNLRPE